MKLTIGELYSVRHTPSNMRFDAILQALDETSVGDQQYTWATLLFVDGAANYRSTGKPLEPGDTIDLLTQTTDFSPIKHRKVQNIRRASCQQQTA